ncbi:MAG: hypothetical protein IVW36_00540 [Dehalococcoidia bacterium]|nr:hypothetical protein [Dehalococcoidia bacterium]
MQFFIALAVLTTASAAYLLHQFRRLGEAAAPASSDHEADGEELKAA